MPQASYGYEVLSMPWGEHHSWNIKSHKCNSNKKQVANQFGTWLIDLLFILDLSLIVAP